MADETIVQLAHVAGLTAGKTMPLTPGTYEFGPNDADDEGLGLGEPSSVSFGLEVHRTREVVLTPGRLAVSVEGQKVSSPVNVAPGHTIQAGADHFVLLAATDDDTRTRRPIAPNSPITIRNVDPVASARGRGLLFLALILIVAGVILGFALDSLWYLLAGVGILLGVFTWLWRGRSIRAAHKRREVEIQQAKDELAISLMDRRVAVAQERRSEVTGPAEILSQGALLPSVALAIGAGDTEWTPRTGRSESVGWNPHPIIEDYSSVSSVPFTVDPADGPIALSGPRSATLAVARYLTVAAMHHFGPEQVTLSSDDDESWTWADDSVRRGNTGFVVIDRDDPELPDQGIVILDADQPLPHGLDRAVRVTENSMAHAADSEGNLLAADLVPYGLTASAARAAAAAVVRQHAVTPQRPKMPTSRAQRAGDAPDRLTGGDTPDLSSVSTNTAPAADDLASTQATATNLVDIDLTDTDPTELDTAASHTADSDIAESDIVDSDTAESATSDDATIDLRDDADTSDEFTLGSLSPGNATVLFTVDDHSIGRELVASVAIDMAHRRTPEALAVGIIDSAERGLIRLRQLPHCVGYTALDDERGIETVLDLVDAHTDGNRQPGESDTMVLVISDLGPLLDHLNATGRGQQARRLILAASSSDDQRLIIAASNAASRAVDPDFDACVTSRVDYSTAGGATILDARGERPLPTTDFSARDLTGAVATIKHATLDVAS